MRHRFHSNDNKSNYSFGHGYSRSNYRNTNTSSASNCPFYGSAKGCRYGNQCQYNHSYPNSIPFCKFYSSTNRCRYGSNCKFRHSSNNNQNNNPKSQQHPHENIARLRKNVPSKTAWNNVKPMYYGSFPKPIKLNDRQFAIVPSRIATDLKSNQDYCDGIYAYDIISNDWNKIINYPKNLTVKKHGATYNQTTNCIYIINAESQSNLLAFDLTKRKCKIVNKKAGYFGKNPGMISIGHEIHIFGSDTSVYAIYDCNRKKLFNKTMPDEYQIVPSSAMYLESKNIILIFGFWLKEIYLYSLLDRTWSKRSIDIQINDTLFALTSDEEHIFCIGEDDMLLIYDVDRNVFTRTDIKKPAFRDPKMIIMKNDKTSEVLTFGYVRNVFDGILPLDIINMISNWIKYESLYMFQRGRHKKIDLDEMFKSLKR